jgi:hypothetical protein
VNFLCDLLRSDAARDAILCQWSKSLVCQCGGLGGSNSLVVVEGEAGGEGEGVRNLHGLRGRWEVCSRCRDPLSQPLP